MPLETYLGDGLYGSYDGNQIELYASDGERKTNQVFLDGDVLEAFLRFVQQIKTQQAEGIRA